jgi:hypothetical protein
MPITITEAEYVDGIMNATDRCLIDHARWEGVPAGEVVRDIIEQFITPKCYLIRPGAIADGPNVSIIIGEEVDGYRTPAYRNAGGVIQALAILCGYQVFMTLDGRLHFGPPTG